MQNIIRTIIRYRKMVAGIELSPIYDGRGKGVDAYVCEKCGCAVFTRYADKGVTPFSIRCRECGDFMIHRQTLSEELAKELRATVFNWYRPSLWRTILSSRGTREHVLKGGLVIETESEYFDRILGHHKHIYR